MMPHIISSPTKVATLAFSRQRSAASFMAYLLLSQATIRAGDSDDTLRYYLSKSPLVVSGKIVTAGVTLSKGGARKPYGISLNGIDVLKGALNDKTIEARCVQFVLTPSESPEFLKPDTRVILFLRRCREARGEGSGWLGVDPWFAVQPESALMRRALGELAAASASDPEPTPVEVDECGDMTLRYYKSRASLVVSGDITEISSATYSDDSTCRRSLRVKVSRIIRGSLQGEEVTASVVRFEDKASKPAFLKAGNRVILFLRERNGEPRYETVDPWFGVQQYNTHMEATLDEVWAED